MNYKIQHKRVNEFINTRNQRRIEREERMNDVANDRLEGIHNRFIANRNINLENNEPERPNIINNVVIPPLRRLPERNQDNQTIQTDAQRLYLQQQEDRLSSEFQNPRVRDLYNNNRIYLGGRRVIPGANNRVEYGETMADPNDNNHINFILNGDTRKFECPICMDEVYWNIN